MMTHSIVWFEAPNFVVKISHVEKFRGEWDERFFQGLSIFILINELRRLSAYPTSKGRLEKVLEG